MFIILDLSVHKHKSQMKLSISIDHFCLSHLKLCQLNTRAGFHYNYLLKYDGILWKISYIQLTLTSTQKSSFIVKHTLVVEF